MLVARAKAPLGLNFFSHDYLCAESTPLHIVERRVGSRDKTSRAESTASWRRCLPVRCQSISSVRHLHFHTWSRQTIGRVMAGIPRREVSNEFRVLTRGKFSVHVTRARCHPSFFFFTSNSKYPCRVDIGIPQSGYLTFSIR